jgi:exodeoxyribonuclease V alpha subunit
MLTAAEVFEGTLERITYYNPQNGYSVVQVVPNKKTPDMNLDDDGLVTVVGAMPEVQPGETLRCTGTWMNHPTFGRQFKAETVIQIAPSSLEGIKRYLSSGLIKGVGAKTADKIVRHFKENTLTVLDNQPELLHDVLGIKQELVDKIKKAWGEQRAIKDVMIFLQSHNITTGLAVKIYKQYGDQSVRIVSADPYQLAKDVEGIGFRTADKIAQDMGIATNAPERLTAGVVYALEQNALDGHTFSPRPALIEYAADLLDAPPEAVAAAIDRLQRANDIVIDSVRRGEETIEAVYLPLYYYTERGVSKRLHDMQDVGVSTLTSIKKVKWASFFTTLAKEDQIELTDQQQDAVKAVVTNKVSILTGGPGTGKTTTLRAVIRMLEVNKKTYVLASPTGRAAKRLGEATGRPAQTIHRLLMYSPQNGWGFHEDSPLQTDVVIVDEASMLDLMLFYQLLRAIKPETHLLLVGDVDQLPSVGAGDVLRDIIGSGIAHVTRLKIIFRQSQESLIIANAHRINQGEIPDISNSGADFFMFVTDDVERAADLVVEVVTTRIPNKFALNPETDIQVLAPMYRGPVGVEALNRRLQEALNPPGRTAEKKIGNVTFRVGDRVMQLRNNYDKGVFNGDIGRVFGIDFDDQSITVVFDDVFIDYDFTEADELTHAFCISTHKSQGSEYPAVVLPVVASHYMMLQRNLLYTAVTRAKSLVVLVGSKKALAMAIGNDKVAERYSGLWHRLQ